MFTHVYSSVSSSIEKTEWWYKKVKNENIKKYDITQCVITAILCD